jgi:hypothetical protein
MKQLDRLSQRALEQQGASLHERLTNHRLAKRGEALYRVTLDDLTPGNEMVVLTTPTGFESKRRHGATVMGQLSEELHGYTEKEWP